MGAAELLVGAGVAGAALLLGLLLLLLLPHPATRALPTAITDTSMQILLLIVSPLGVFAANPSPNLEAARAHPIRQTGAVPVGRLTGGIATARTA